MHTRAREKTRAVAAHLEALSGILIFYFSALVFFIVCMFFEEARGFNHLFGVAV